MPEEEKGERKKKRRSCVVIKSLKSILNSKWSNKRGSLLHRNSTVSQTSEWVYLILVPIVETVEMDQSPGNQQHLREVAVPQHLLQFPLLDLTTSLIPMTNPMSPHQNYKPYTGALRLGARCKYHRKVGRYLGLRIY